MKMSFITKLINQIKKQKVVIPIHEDARHGWAEVKLQDLERFGIKDKISIYSYQDGDKVYLDEDCDAPLYVSELKKRGIAHEFKVVTDEYESFVRGLKKYGI